MAGGVVEKMIPLFTKDPYAHITDFIDAAVDSTEISAWLEALENEPDHMRLIRLAEMKNKMAYGQAPEEHIEIVSLLNNFKILQAMNNVIQDVHRSGLPTRKFIGKGDGGSYNALISLIVAAIGAP